MKSYNYSTLDPMRTLSPGESFIFTGTSQVATLYASRWNIKIKTSKCLIIDRVGEIPTITRAVRVMVL